MSERKQATRRDRAEMQATIEAQAAEIRALRTRLRDLRLLTDNATMGLLVLDERQHATFLNPAGEAITGFRLEEMRGRPAHEVIHHTRPDGSHYPMEDCPIDRAFPERNQMQGEDVFVRRDGSFYPVAFTASPLLDDFGAAVGTVVEFRDTTEEKAAEAERERLLHALQQAIRARDEFLSIAGHELKTPLAALQLQVQGLQRHARDDSFGPATRRLLGRLEKTVGHVRRLERLINELLDVSRIGAGRLVLQPVETDLAAIVLEVVERFRDQARIDIRLSIPEPVYGVFDPLRFDQIVTNLVGNAMKYGAGKPIEVSLASDGELARLRVHDQGIGIPANDRQRIFERFERAVSERNYGGLGLGLWITREIVQAMGGTIALLDGTDGTTFVVEVPLQPPGS